jgi:probable F420-dependent oxidoreductase
VINELMDGPGRWIERVRQAEAVGYGTWLIRDHFVPDYFGDQYAPLVALAFAAATTSTIHLGTMVIDNDYRHPVMLAKETATLDVLSGGRFELGLGAGWLRNEYERAGMPFDRNGVRIDRLEEAIRVLKSLWSGQPASFCGAHYRIDGLQGVPLPANKPHPPLLIGAGHQRMLRLAGREADSVGILTSSVASGALVADPREMLPESVDQKLGWIRAGAGERFAEIELSLMPAVHLTDRRRATTEQLIAERGWQGLSVEQVWSMPNMLIGSLEQLAADLVERRERYGFSYAIFSDQHMQALAPLVARLAGA